MDPTTAGADAQALVDAVKARDAAKARDLLARRPALRGARTPEGMGVLQLALYLRASQVVDALLAAGWEPDVFEAAAMGDAARVRALAQHDRARVAAQGADGATPLHLAAHFGHADVVRLLLHLGTPVDLYAGGAFGNTALHAAAAGGQDAVVELLLHAGAKPDLPDKNGFTPLHVAAANGLARSVRLLLAKGADPRAAAKDGRTPLDVAREREMDEVAALLG